MFHVINDNNNNNIISSSIRVIIIIYCIIIFSKLCKTCKTYKGSKPVTCRFLDIKLEAQIGERSFQICNSSIQVVSVNLQ